MDCERASGAAFVSGLAPALWVGSAAVAARELDMVHWTDSVCPVRAYARVSR